MSEYKLHIEPGGLINKEKLFAYLRNELNDSEKNRIEKLIAQDPFLQDAVEGLKGADLKTVENVLSAIYAKVDAASSVQRTNTFSSNFRKYAAAASIVLFLGMSWVIIDKLNNKQQDKNNIAAQQAISADKNSEAYVIDDSSDMGSGSAAGDSISMDELKKEPVYINRSKQMESEPDNTSEAKYDFNYTDDSRSELSISTEMIITPPIMVDENITLSSATSTSSKEDVAETDKAVSGSAVDAENIEMEDNTFEQDKAVSLKKEKKIKNNASKAEAVEKDIVLNNTPALDDYDSVYLVFAAVSPMPAYPGGPEALNQFLVENLKGNCEGNNNCKNGDVFIKFIVNVDGTISDKQIIRTVYPKLNDEILRVMSLMPKWIPGEQNGVKVRVWYTLKVTIDYK